MQQSCCCSIQCSELLFLFCLQAVGKLHSLWTSFAKFYERHGDLPNARVVFEKATEVRAQPVQGCYLQNYCVLVTTCKNAVHWPNMTCLCLHVLASSLVAVQGMVLS